MEVGVVTRHKRGIWYHVTERGNAERILRDGFVAGNGSAGMGTYLWADLRLAEDWIDGHISTYVDPVIIQVHTRERPVSIYALYNDAGHDDAEQYHGHYVLHHDKNWKPNVLILD